MPLHRTSTQDAAYPHYYYFMRFVLVSMPPAVVAFVVSVRVARLLLAPSPFLPVPSDLTLPGPVVR